MSTATLHAPRPASRADLFPRARWIYDRVSGSAVDLDDLRPCGCGGVAFVWVLRATGQVGGLYCAACYEDPATRLARPGDVPYARVDARTRRAAYGRGLPPDVVVAMRERMLTGVNGEG